MDVTSVAPKRRYEDVIILSDDEESSKGPSPVSLSSGPTREASPATSSRLESPAIEPSSSSRSDPTSSPKRARPSSPVAPQKIHFTIDLTQDDDSDVAEGTIAPATAPTPTSPVARVEEQKLASPEVTQLRDDTPSTTDESSRPSSSAAPPKSPELLPTFDAKPSIPTTDLPLTRLLDSNPELLTQSAPEISKALMDQLGYPIGKARALAEFVRTLSQMRRQDRDLAEQLHQFLDEEFDKATRKHLKFKQRSQSEAPASIAHIQRKAAEYMTLRKIILNERDALRHRVAADIVSFNNIVRSRIKTFHENMVQRDRSEAMSSIHHQVHTTDRAQTAADENYVRARQESINRPEYIPASHPYSGVNVPTFEDAPSRRLEAYSRNDIDHLVNQLRAPIVARPMPPELIVDPHEHQRYGLGWLLQAERSRNRGGILSDDMGLGKTIQTIALLYANPPSGRDATSSPVPTRGSNNGTTGDSNNSIAANTPVHRGGSSDSVVLIVCPVAVLEHWNDELRKRVRPASRLRVYLHHRGLVKELYTASEIRKKCDVVIASYAGVANEFKHKRERSGQSPLFNIHWHRVVLDEAHIIRNANTQTSLACAALDADYRLCLTGTPMQNRPDDLYALVRFLRIEPWWKDHRAFTQMIARPSNISEDIEEGESNSSDKKNATLVALLAAISLRRTKNTVVNGKKILEGLPSKTDKDLELTMQGEEQVEYFEFAQKIRHRAMELRRLRLKDISFWGQALVMLMRLRQQSCHPRLIEFTSQPQESELTRDEFDAGLKRAKKLDLNLRERIIFVYDYGYRGTRRFRDELESSTTCDQCINYCQGASTSFVINSCGHIACSECRVELEDDSTTRYCQKADCGAEFNHLIPFEAVELVFDNPQSPLKELGDIQSRRDSDRQKVRLREKKDRQDRLRRLTTRGGSVGIGNPISTLELDLAEDDSEDDNFMSGKRLPTPATSSSAPGPSVGRTDGLDFDSDSDVDLGLTTSGVLRGQPPKTEPMGALAIDDFSDDDLDTIPVPNLPAKKEQEEQPEAQKSAKEEWDPVAFRLDIDEVARMSVCHKVFEDGWVSSAKVDKILEILRVVLREDRRTKVIIFSSFTSMLDFLSIPLMAAMIGYEQYHGRLNAGARQQVLQKFRTDPHCNVLLASIKAGNVGLTLTEASRVIIVDPYWNPYVEEQAKDRVYRIGQRKPVTVYRTLVKGTVEDRIIEIQKNKRDIIEGAQDPRAHSRVRALTQQELFYTLGVGQNPNTAPPVPTYPEQDTLLSALM